jgi:hypothetical protein
MAEDIGEDIFTFVVMALMLGGLIGVFGSFVILIWSDPSLAMKVFFTSVVACAAGLALGQGL